MTYKYTVTHTCSTIGFAFSVLLLVIVGVGEWVGIHACDRYLKFNEVIGLHLN